MLRTLLAALVICALAGPSLPARAEEDTVKKPPAPAIPVEKGGSLIGSGRLVIEPSVTYSCFAREKVSISGFTIFEAITVGQIDVGRTKRNIINPALTVRYGLQDLELSTRIPYFIRTDDESFPVESTVGHFSASDSDLGDVEMAGFYHLLRETRMRPDIVIGFTGKSDTGRDPYHLKKQQIPNSQSKLLQFPTGNGHWGVAGTIIFVKTSDPAVLFVNTTYYYNLPRTVPDFGDVNLGDSIEYQMGLVLGLNERLAVNFSLGQRITWDSSQGGRVVRDSGGNAAQANFGVTYAFSREMSIDVVTSLGLTDDAPDFSIGVRLPITFLL